ncbi:MAG: PLD nuclease N-terminal domain-containing protein [Bacteroidota bacterium]
MPLVALINLLKNQFTGNDKLIWLLVILFLPLMGWILYFAIGKKNQIH